MTDTGATKERYLSAILRTLSDPASDHHRRNAAARALVQHVPTLARAFLLRQFGSQLGTDDVNDAISYVLLKASSQSVPFKGKSEGEAVRWIQVVARNNVLNMLARRNIVRSEFEKEVSVSATQRYRDDLRDLHRLLTRVRLAAGRKRPRVEAFILHRLGDLTGAEQAQVASGKSRDAIYQDRSRGKLDLVALIDQLIPPLTPEERGLLLRFAGKVSDEARAAGLSERKGNE